MGKKNRLFFGGAEAGRISAIYSTLLENFSQNSGAKVRALTKKRPNVFGRFFHGLEAVAYA
jgi:hypothetical protein